MDLVLNNDSATQAPRQRAVAALRVVPVATWSFVYVFFSNGTPFDSPNRSEPCPSF
jgi:hypothetical protein